MTARSRLEQRREPQQARSRATRERILEAAARVLAEHGYARGTTNRIADAAGLSIGSLYQYFPNKDAVLAELVRRHARDGVAALADLPLDGPLDAVLHAAVEALAALHREDQRLHQVLFEQAPRPADVLEDLRRIEEAYVQIVAGKLASDGTVHVTDPEAAARLVVWTLESLVHRAAAAGRLDDQHVLDAVVPMLLSHLRAQSNGAR
ncbi:MAG: TetR/AcrR family transcriptional regulator [Chloroflexota bacterium]|nr:TetR/AcrR family transcriptional regulator [Chloroflexota bacterium]